MYFDLFFIFNLKGYFDFYQGVAPFTIGSSMSMGVYFIFYELLKKKFKIEVGSLMGYSVSAFCSGFMSCLVTTPFWTINAR